MKKTISLIMILACICTLFSGCGCMINKNEAFSESGYYFNTLIYITLYGNDKEYIDDCFDECKKLESYFSNTITTSDVSKINDNPGEFIEVHDETLELIQAGIKYSKLSDGDFDITCGNLVDTWDIENSNKPPKSEDISKSLEGIDYKCIEVDGNKIKLNSDKAKIDLGGIAKGYIADYLVDYLRKKDVSRGIINLGGNIITLDSVKDNNTYYLGIQKPFDEDGNTICELHVKNTSVVTSGTYQRYYKYQGKLYHHILDLNTGYPVDNNLNAVTIICKSSTQADALSTITFVKGLDQGMKFIESLDDVEAIFVLNDNSVKTTSGINKYYYALSK